jgi:hypothetical protein
LALDPDRAQVPGLNEVIPVILQPLDRGADLLPADELDGDVGHPPRSCTIPA